MECTLRVLGWTMRALWEQSDPLVAVNRLYGLRVPPGHKRTGSPRSDAALMEICKRLVCY